MNLNVPPNLKVLTYLGGLKECQDFGRGQGQQTTAGDPTFQVLVKLMEGMQLLQGRLLDDRDGDRARWSGKCPRKRSTASTTC